MEQLDSIGAIVVIASCTFIFGLTVALPAYSFFCRWKEKRAFRLRDKRDARLTVKD